jgi:hypothetical protein
MCIPGQHVLCCVATGLTQGLGCIAANHSTCRLHSRSPLFPLQLFARPTHPTGMVTSLDSQAPGLAYV